MDLVLDVTTSAGIPRGTVRLASQPASDAIAFHGLLELVAVLDRFLGDAPSGPADDR